MLIKNADRSWFAFTVDWHWLITAAGVLLLQNVIIVLRWQYLLKLAGIKLSFFEAFSLTMQGLFFMLFIPGGAASGDLIKIALVIKDCDAQKRFNAGASVLIDRLSGVAGLLLLTLLFSLYLLFFNDGESLVLFHWGMGGLVWACLGAAAITMLFWADYFLRIKWIGAVYGFCNRLLRDFPGRLLGVIVLYRKHSGYFVFWCLISGLVTFPLLAAVLICIALGIGLHNELAAVVKGAFCSISYGEFAGMLPLTPGGIGVRDAVYKEFFHLFGIEQSASTLIALIYSSVMVTINSIGGVFAVFRLFRKHKNAVK